MVPEKEWRVASLAVGESGSRGTRAERSSPHG
jgi:hypothetical protein